MRVYVVHLCCVKAQTYFLLLHSYVYSSFAIPVQGTYHLSRKVPGTFYRTGYCYLLRIIWKMYPDETWNWNEFWLFVPQPLPQLSLMLTLNWFWPRLCSVCFEWHQIDFALLCEKVGCIVLRCGALYWIRRCNSILVQQQWCSDFFWRTDVSKESFPTWNQRWICSPYCLSPPLSSFVF